EIGGNETRLGHFDEALVRLRRARALFAATYGEHSQAIGTTDFSIGEVYYARGDLDGARDEFHRAYTTLAALSPPDHGTLATIENALANVEAQAGHLASALPHHQHVVAMY